MAVLSFRHETGFARDSRFLDGHFPGNPIVPGAIIIAYLSQRLAENRVSVASIDRMKFMRPLSPDTPFDVEAAINDGSGRVLFIDAEGVFASARVAVSGLDG